MKTSNIKAFITIAVKKDSQELVVRVNVAEADAQIFGGKLANEI